MLVFVPSMVIVASSAAHAETVHVAVASNFLAPTREIAAEFTSITGHQVNISAGSTGHLFAQIRNAAPYDVFLAADARRPLLLEQAGAAVDGSRFTYAFGQLALWSRDPNFADRACANDLRSLGRRKLAIANPALAPYGFAAKQYLQDSGAWDDVQSTLVFGENIAQTLHFATSGNASIAIIARSQITAAARFEPVCVVSIGEHTHAPIRQQAVRLRGAIAEAGQFLEFLRGPKARAVIENHGYRVPELP